MIHEPQDAAAAGICWLARWSTRGRLHGAGDGAVNAASMRHPRECGWCPYPSDALIGWFEDFNRRDGDENRISGRFRAMPTARQRELVDRSLYSEEGVPA